MPSASLSAGCFFCSPRVFFPSAALRRQQPHASAPHLHSHRANHATPCVLSVSDHSELPKRLPQCQAVALANVEARVIVHNLSTSSRIYNKAAFVGALRKRSKQQKQKNQNNKQTKPQKPNQQKNTTLGK